MRFSKKCKFIMPAILALSLLLQIPALPAEAAGLIAPAKGWIRARIDYDYDSGITRLNDKRITFSANWGTRQEDGWYYYGYPVESGDSVSFIEGVSLPASWTEDVQNKNFSINITVEAAEITSANEEGWDANTTACYSYTFPLFSSGGADLSAASQWDGRLRVSIDEYQADEDGAWSEYENAQLVTPGQFVSKIVVFTLQRTLVRQTGDDMAVFLYGGVFLAAAAGMICIARRERRAAQRGGSGT